jgi:hypothetical protein
VTNENYEEALAEIETRVEELGGVGKHAQRGLDDGVEVQEQRSKGEL